MNPNPNSPAPVPRKVGRPTKATPATLAKLADAIATGLTDEQAAALAGVSADSLARWQATDPEFCGAVKRACAERLRTRLERIATGAPGWQGTAWILERTMRGQFAPPKTTAALEHSGGVGFVVSRSLADQISAARAAAGSARARPALPPAD